MARMFIALWPDPAVRDRLVAWRDAWSWPRSATPVRTERLHLTLHFIGDVERGRVQELADALDVPFDGFGLQFGSAALWPHGVAVLEPHAGPAALVELREALGAVLERLALPVDARPFRPHVTMARRAAGSVVPRHGPVVDWDIDRYVLMESAHDGYAVVREYCTSAPRQTGI
ncbi:MAG: RNA 2',3'-cyclic phosphodiesterase [Pseudomonadota bacterium]